MQMGNTATSKADKIKILQRTIKLKGQTHFTDIYRALTEN